MQTHLIYFRTRYMFNSSHKVLSLWEIKPAKNEETNGLPTSPPLPNIVCSLFVNILHIMIHSHCCAFKEPLQCSRYIFAVYSWLIACMFDSRNVFTVLMLCSKTCLATVLIRLILRWKNCTSASARVQFFQRKIEWINTVARHVLL